MNEKASELLKAEVEWRDIMILELDGFIKQKIADFKKIAQPDGDTFITYGTKINKMRAELREHGAAANACQIILNKITQ